VSELYISTTGLIRTLYDESLPLHVFGHLQIVRASHVEPDCQGRWWVDLSPSSGPKLGPFLLRSAALQTESDWLRQHVLSPPSNEMTEMRDKDDTLPRQLLTEHGTLGTAQGTLEAPPGGADLPGRPAGNDS